MTTVVRKEGEQIEDTLKRFRREVARVGTLREARKREHYEKPSDAKKIKFPIPQKDTKLLNDETCKE